MTNLLDLYKAWRKRRAKEKTLVLLKEETGTSLIRAAHETLSQYDGSSLSEGYHKSIGELIRVEFSFDPMALLEAAELFADVIGHDDYIPQSFAQPDRQSLTLDEWLTVNGAYVRTSLWYPRMLEAISMLHGALRAAEVCATDKHSYYLRRSKMLISDISELARVLITLEGK